MLLTEKTPFIIVLAIDPRVVTKAIEQYFGKHLLEAGINGYEFLDKVVQIPFVIPTMTRDDTQTLCDGLLGGTKGDALDKLVGIVTANIVYQRLIKRHRARKARRNKGVTGAA